MAIWSVLLIGSGGMILWLAVVWNKPNPKVCEFGIRAAEMFHQAFNDPGNLQFSTNAWDRESEVARTPSGIFDFGRHLRSFYVQDARTKLGRLQSVRMKECETSHVLGQTYVRLTYDDQFERGQANETIGFMIAPEDDKPTSATMTSYSITSPLFQRHSGS